MRGCNENIPVASILVTATVCVGPIHPVQDYFGQKGQNGEKAVMSLLWSTVSLSSLGSTFQ